MLRDATGVYSVMHHQDLIYRSTNRALADAYYEVARDELVSRSGVDPLAQVRAEQSFRDIIGVRGDATRRRTTKENTKGGKGGRGGT